MSSACRPRSARSATVTTALTAAVISLYKAEPIRGPGQGPWKSVNDLELATLGWVTWFDAERLHGTLGNIPPAEYEADYRHTTETNQSVGIQ